MVIIVVGIIVGVSFTGGGGSAKGSGLGMQPASADVVHATTNVPRSVLSKVGLGTTSTIASPERIKGPPPLLMSSGKPELFYFGANYCPYCATERWPMVVALSRFGTFSGLKQTHSSTKAGEPFPGTQTFSFYGSTYTSRYLSFVPVELTTNQPYKGYYKPLQTPTKAELALVAKYDVAPYVANATSGQDPIPFLDFANRYLLSGPSYSPQVLQGLSAGTIAGSLSLPSTPTAQGIGASANWMTAAICQLTHDQPGAVCSGSVIKKAEAALAKESPK
ncbi:MAG: DUF929 family protein [Acidimicrobiales bacterium]